MFFSSSTTSTVRGAGAPGGGGADGPGCAGANDAGGAAEASTMGGGESVARRLRLGPPLLEVSEVAQRLRDERAARIALHDRLERVAGLVPLVHPEVGLGEQQQRRGSEVRRR